MSDLKIKKIAQNVAKASQELSVLSSNKKNKILKDLVRELKKSTEQIVKANKKDLRNAKNKGLSDAMIDRLVLNEDRILGMCSGVMDVVKLPDPIGEVVERRSHSGLKIRKERIPLGVICMIYESRPNVTIDAAALCFKSGNAVILRGGSEAFESNKILILIVQSVLKSHGLNPAMVSMVPFTDRKAMVTLLKQDQFINVVIPRGGEGLMKFISENTRIPVIKHDRGVCSLFVDATADLEKSIKVIENAKVQRPGVCNALETLYVHEKISTKFLPNLIQKLQNEGVEIRGDEKVKRIVPSVKKAKESDFSTEYLDLILSIKVVGDVDQAIEEVLNHSSKHTDGILSKSKSNIDKFVKSLDSSCVVVNTSTRFNDGGQLGLGAEIGISTTKIHAYGPMGLRELTTTKYVVESDYKIRA